MAKLNLFWMSVFTIFSQCTQSQSPQSKLPAKLPEKFNIRFYDGGGMLPQSDEIYISKDSCYLEYFYNQARNKIYFSLTQEELEQLYQVFVKNQFHKIKADEEKEVYDRGGTHLSLMIDNQYIDKSDSGLSFIQANWKQAYGQCVSAVRQIATQKTAALKKDIKIQLDSSISESGHIVSLQIADSQFNYYSEVQGIQTQMTVSLYPGQHSLGINLIGNTEPSYQRKSIASSFFIFEVKESTKGIKFSLRENKLILEEF